MDREWKKGYYRPEGATKNPVPPRGGDASKPSPTYKDILDKRVSELEAENLMLKKLLKIRLESCQKVEECESNSHSARCYPECIETRKVLGESGCKE